MGWFLSSKKKKKRAKPKRSGSMLEPKGWDPQRTLAGLKALGLFAAAVGLVIGWRYSERYLLDYADRHRPVTRVTADVIELIDAPAWMSEGIREQVRESAARHIDPDPMDGRSLRLSAEALRNDPWVRDITQVARRSNGQVLVWATYRRPVAIIQADDGYHLIDSQGVCLPGVYRAHEVNGLGLITIMGVPTPPPARAGEVWPGEEVQAGLSLLRLLANEPYMDKIRAFDVSERDERDRLRLVLHTEDGTVRWGLPPGQEHAIEPSAEIKLGWLRKLAQNDADLSTAGQIIDIYGPVPGSRQP
jgi:hypothetical protein